MKQTTSPKNHTQSTQLRHGVQYISRDKQPTMFQILSWDQNYDAAKNNKWLINLNHPQSHQRFSQTQIYQKTYIQPYQSPQKKQNNHLQPHPLKHDLYYYGEQQINKKLEKPTPSQKKSPEKSKEVKKLDNDKIQEKKQINIRKQNIEKFNAFTRQLPDSAFTTYFGKPAFGHYAIGSLVKSKSISDLKSHSVMPHAGKNHPQIVQSHQGALNKANVINLQTHVPRIKMQSPHPDCRVDIKEYYNVEIVKPDLINQVKFANEDRDLRFRSKTPKHNELNYLPKRQYKSPPVIKTGKKNGKSKGKVGKKGKEEAKVQGLAFMERKEGFMNEVGEKKRVHNRLAYKVTQCHPYNWDNQTQAASTSKQQKWLKVRPAGLSSSKSLR